MGPLGGLDSIGVLAPGLNQLLGVSQRPGGGVPVGPGLLEG